MHAVILAAGSGSRLDQHALPKCLITFGGAHLVEHQLASLRAAGVSDVWVVVGYEQDHVRVLLGDRVRYVVNEAFATTNSLVLNSDLLVHPELVAGLVDTPGDALLYDAGSGQDEEHMKVSVGGGLLLDMSKRMPAHEVSGENLGILRLTSATVAAVASAAREAIAEGGYRSWLAEAVRRVCRERPIQCSDASATPWVEIDFPEDLQRAREHVFPCLEGAFAALQ